MSDEWDDLCNMPWVDVFTEPNFQGRIHRLHGDAATGALIIRRPDLPLFRSMIVGPVASAELQRSGNSQPIRLSPGTILPDTAPLAGRSAILSLAVLSDLD